MISDFWQGLFVGFLLAYPSFVIGKLFTLIFKAFRDDRREKREDRIKELAREVCRENKTKD